MRKEIWVVILPVRRTKIIKKSMNVAQRQSNENETQLITTLAFKSKDENTQDGHIISQSSLALVDSKN